VEEKGKKQLVKKLYDKQEKSKSIDMLSKKKKIEK